MSYLPNSVWLDSICYYGPMLRSPKILDCFVCGPGGSQKGIGHLARLRDVVKNQAFADGTYINRRSHWQAYLLFCRFYNVCPLPITEETVCNYAVFLACSLTAYRSIRNYLSSLCHFQSSNGFEVNWESSYNLSLTLRGLKCILGDRSNQKSSITPAILMDIFCLLDFTKVGHMAFNGHIFLVASMI